jgi:transposase-like protein
VAQWRTVADQVRVKFPKLGALMDEAESDILAFISFPKAHRVQIHSTNPLERLNAEIKRHTDVVVGIFPIEPAITRLVGKATNGNCSVAICSLKDCRHSPSVFSWKSSSAAADESVTDGG